MDRNNYPEAAVLALPGIDRHDRSHHEENDSGRQPLRKTMTKGFAVPESTMDQIPLKHFSRKQRRVLGTLLEKAFTTPDQYPLTLKATVAGCNQKSNRDPTTNYDEDAVQQTLEELRELGFVAVLYTEGGRSERYRHYMRHRTKLTEIQLAVMTELMLRGRQQMGELRTRASRMVPIDSLEDLRKEMIPLQELGIIRSNGPLERRGIEVDHNLYAPGENHEPMGVYQEDASPASPSSVSRGAAVAAEPIRRAEPAPSSAGQERVIEGLTQTVAELNERVGQLQEQLTDLKDQVSDLRRQLGA